MTFKTAKSECANAARKKKIKAAGSGALALAALMPPPGVAQTYDVSNETELSAAIHAANASAAASATINLTSSFTGQGVPAVAKPITFDLHGFSMTSTYAPATLTTSGTIALTGPAGAGLLTLSGAGAILGADAGPADATNGGNGLFLNTQAALVNAATITGGAGGGAGGGGGAGARMLNGASLLNTGVIAGGQGLAGGGGQGAQLSSGALINNGTIRGGDSVSTNGGVGVLFRSPGQPSTLTNNAGGIIRGGAGAGAVLGGAGIDVRAGVGQIINAGTVEGGSGGVAISSNSAPIDLINSGTIRAGAG